MQESLQKRRFLSCLEGTWKNWDKCEEALETEGHTVIPATADISKRENVEDLIFLRFFQEIGRPVI